MTEVTARRRGRQGLEAAEKTKQEILKAATVLFAKKGFDACSIREVATAANVSHGIIRHHFGSKRDIWMAITESALQHYQERLIPFIIRAAQSEAVLDGFKSLVRSFIHETNLQPELICLMAKEGGSESERSLYFRNGIKLIHKQITPLFEQAQKECKALQKYNCDSFFLFLMSMTIMPLVMPNITSFIVMGRQTKKQLQAREDLIVQMLFE